MSGGVAGLSFHLVVAGGWWMVGQAKAYVATLHCKFEHLSDLIFLCEVEQVLENVCDLNSYILLISYLTFIQFVFLAFTVSVLCVSGKRKVNKCKPCVPF